MTLAATAPPAGTSAPGATAALSIIIVNWNTRKMLARCLDAILGPVEGSLTAAGGDRSSCEVFVVDNASTDGSGAMVEKRFPEVRLITNEENLGFARANNQAIRQASGRYVLLLNPDTEVLPRALEFMIQCMEQLPQAGGCGPLLLNADGSLHPSCHPMLTPEREFWRLIFLDRLWPRATYQQEAWDQATARRVEVIKGACLLLRREALEEVGLLDEDYFVYTEEMDLCYRLARAGWQLWWVPRAVVRHNGEASTKQAAEAMYVQLYRSKVQFYRKFGGSCRAARFKCLVGLAYWPRLVAAMFGGTFSPCWKGRAALYRRLLLELPGM